LDLLKIKSVDLLHTITPITEDDIMNFNLRAPGSIRITEANWTFAFLKTNAEPFNREAVAVFAESFLQRVADGWYCVPVQFPESFKNTSLVQKTFIDQLDYLRRCYKAQTSDIERDKLKAKSSRIARARRKQKVSFILSCESQSHRRNT